VAGDWRHPRVPGERVVQGGEDAYAVFGGCGNVAADGKRVAGDLLGAEPAGDFLLGIRRVHVTFGLVRGRRYPQVRQEPEDVVLAVVQAFEQQPGGGAVPRRRRGRGAPLIGRPGRHAGTAAGASRRPR
jgi:hypothetical protein